MKYALHYQMCGDTRLLEDPGRFDSRADAAFYAVSILCADKWHISVAFGDGTPGAPEDWIEDPDPATHLEYVLGDKLNYVAFGIRRSKDGKCAWLRSAVFQDGAEEDTPIPGLVGGGQEWIGPYGEALMVGTHAVDSAKTWLFERGTGHDARYWAMDALAFLRHLNEEHTAWRAEATRMDGRG